MKLGNGRILIKDNNGTTMVSVIISFALLMIFVTTFFGVQKVSQNMMMNAKDMLVNSRELAKAYYLEETENQIVADEVRLTFSGENGAFYVDATLNKAQKEGLTGTIYFYESVKEEQENQ